MDNLERTENGVSFVENVKNGMAWHGLGQHFDRPLTVSEAMSYGADFTVEKRHIVAVTPEMEDAIKQGLPLFINPSMLVEGKQATVRTDNDHALGIVSDRYTIVQNIAAFKFIDALTSGRAGDETPTIDCAGVLGKGERIFITARFPNEITLGASNDVASMYIVFTTSHDGSGAVSCMITPIRVVCNNTLNMAFRNNSGMFTLRHSRFVNDRLSVDNTDNIAAAHKVLGTLVEYRKQLEVEAQRLLSISVTDADVDRIVTKLVCPVEENRLALYGGETEGRRTNSRRQNRIDKIKDVIASGVGQKETKSGTGMWLINGITTYFQNTQGYKTKSAHFDSLLTTTGVGYKALQSVHDAVLELA